MGCDIHLVVEKRRQKPKLVVTKRDDQKVVTEIPPKDNGWEHCEITPSGEWGDRVYGMFAKLANVRNQWDFEPIELRGFPEDASYDTLQKYAYLVLPDEKFEEWFPEDKEEMIHYSDYSGTYISESKAQYYINTYGAKILKGGPNNKVKFVTEPENHSANWCTLSELEKCVNEIFFDEEIKKYTGDGGEWIALVYYMKGLEVAGYETRCVFWFDN